MNELLPPLAFLEPAVKAAAATPAMANDAVLLAGACAALALS